MRSIAAQLLALACAAVLGGCVSDDRDPYDYNTPYESHQEQLHNSGYYDAEGVYHPSDFELHQQVMIREGQSGTYYYPDSTLYDYPYYYGSNMYRTDPYWADHRREWERREWDRTHPGDDIRWRDGVGRDHASRDSDGDRDRDRREDANRDRSNDRSGDRVNPDNRQRDRDQRDAGPRENNSRESDSRENDRRDVRPENPSHGVDPSKINTPNKLHIPQPAEGPKSPPPAPAERARERAPDTSHNPPPRQAPPDSPRERSDRSAGDSAKHTESSGSNTHRDEAPARHNDAPARRDDSAARRTPPPSGGARQRTR